MEENGEKDLKTILNVGITEEDFENARTALNGGKDYLDNKEFTEAILDSLKGKKASAAFEVITALLILLPITGFAAVDSAMEHLKPIKMMQFLHNAMKKESSIEGDILKNVLNTLGNKKEGNN